MQPSPVLGCWEMVAHAAWRGHGVLLSSVLVSRQTTSTCSEALVFGVQLHSESPMPAVMTPDQWGGSKQHRLVSSTAGGQKAGMGPTGLKSSGSWAVLLLQALGGESVPCLFQLLKVAAFLGLWILPAATLAQLCFCHPISFSDSYRMSASATLLQGPLCLTAPTWIMQHHQPISHLPSTEPQYLSARSLTVAGVFTCTPSCVTKSLQLSKTYMGRPPTRRLVGSLGTTSAPLGSRSDLSCRAMSERLADRHKAAYGVLLLLHCEVQPGQVKVKGRSDSG